MWGVWIEKGMVVWVFVCAQVFLLRWPQTKAGLKVAGLLSRNRAQGQQC